MEFVILFIIILVAYYIDRSNKQYKVKTVQIIKQAQIEYDLENYPKAKILYQKALSRDKNNPYLHHEYAEVLMAMIKFKDAITSFSNAIALKPDYNPSYVRRAFAYLFIKEYRKALEDCSQVINSNASEFIPYGVYTVRGAVFINLRKYQKALEEFKLALQINSDFFLTHACCAEAYCYLGKYEQALESIQKAFAIDTTDANINYLWRGWAYYGLLKFEDALNDCNYYIEKEPDSPKAFEVRGLIYKATSKSDLALKDLEYAVELYKKEGLPSFYYDEINKQIQEIEG